MVHGIEHPWPSTSMPPWETEAELARIIPSLDEEVGLFEIGVYPPVTAISDYLDQFSIQLIESFTQLAWENDED